MKPLIYGYMRLQPDAPDNDIRQLELSLRNYAEHAGYRFATFFYEYDNGRYAAFNALVRELKRADAHHVIMPGLDHLSAHHILRAKLLDRLAYRAQAQVIELDGRRARA